MKIALLIIELLRALPEVIRAFKSKPKEDIKTVVNLAVSSMAKEVKEEKKK
jgi:Ca2+/H+ antiporter